MSSVIALGSARGPGSGTAEGTGAGTLSSQPVEAAADTRAGAMPAFEAVYDEYFAFVWRSLRRLGVAEDALDDAAQDLFLAVHRRLPSFEWRSSLQTWLFGIAVGVARNHRRALRRKDAPLLHNTDLADAHRPSDPGPHGSLARAEAIALLHRFLDDLDDDKRAAFVLAELEQMPVKDVADALGVNLNTVHSRLRAARRAFDEAVARHRARDTWRVR